MPAFYYRGFRGNEDLKFGVLECRKELVGFVDDDKKELALLSKYPAVRFVIVVL